MSGLVKKGWFKNLMLCAGTLAAITAIAVITPPRYVGEKAALTEPDSIDGSSAYYAAEPYLAAGEFNAESAGTAAKWAGRSEEAL